MIDEVIDTAQERLPPARISTGTCLRLGPAPQVKPRDRLIPPKKDLSLSQKTDRSRSLARLRLCASSRRLPELLRSVASVSRHKSTPVKEGKNFFPSLSDTQEILSLLFSWSLFQKSSSRSIFRRALGEPLLFRSYDSNLPALVSPPFAGMTESGSASISQRKRIIQNDSPDFVAIYPILFQEAHKCNFLSRLFNSERPCFPVSVRLKDTPPAPPSSTFFAIRCVRTGSNDRSGSGFGRGDES